MLSISEDITFVFSIYIPSKIILAPKECMPEFIIELFRTRFLIEIVDYDANSIKIMVVLEFKDYFL